VGRITAQVDDNFQAFQDKRWGFFGFFECEDDPEAATALVEAAKAWVTGAGCDRIVGPCDFTTNDESGVLVEGFDRDPIILTNWTKPYYPELLAATGLQKAMDLFMWELKLENRERVRPAIWRLAAGAEQRHGVRFRNFRKKDMDAEVERFMQIYNSAWERNWGFVPLTDHEVRHYAKQLRPILDENWAFVAEKDGEPVGAALTLLDFNQVFKHMNGRVLPFGWAKFLYYKRKIDRIRVFALGVNPDWQHTGIAAKLYERHYDAAEHTRQKHGEMGWILESNKDMNRGMEAMGGELVRRYRLFEMELAQPDDRVS
jgi:GNAT superfamily N-acetyltransferase